MPARPNVVYIFTDQQYGGAMSCVGNQDVHTPAMDRLAAQGTLFEQTYCTQPLCTPCRGSMFTGLMPHECGTPRNNQAIHEHLRGQELGVLMANSGYECVYAGKWHVPQGTMPKDNDHGFRVICPHHDNKLVPACLDYFRERGERREAGPFFLVVSFDDPHNICEASRSMALPWGPLPEPPPVDECPNLPPNFAIPAFEPEIVRVERQENWALSAYRDATQEDWRRLRWTYFRLIERVDAKVGQVLDGLQAHGLDDNTVIVFSSDHGDGHSAHHWNQKCILYEEAVRVPFIVRAPGGTPGAVDGEHLVSNGLDLLPTVCDYAGVEAPAGLRGHSVRPIVEGQQPPAWRGALFIETLFDGRRGYDTQGRAVRTRFHKYIVYDRGRHREQLFYMPHDPGEMVNLAVEARHRHALEAHRALLHQYTTETGDTFAVPGHWLGRQ